ncbi:hypothetical protein [Methylobacterium sp. J-067]|uniref:hypothetical protein n=1 Tax=Methylobacterium sp. J-067 TaxID=2836648 RepID=UPI001FBAB73E|nr:hypothetical protein [Methylobacterium sp. J-067]MCJ2023965.1 hypothetical protein [Methylobacterium sp. J-067]
MSHPSRRSFSWSSALRGIKSDRALVVPGLLAARGLASAYARSRNLPLNITTRSGRGETFAVTHKFDRAAIMTVATLAARDHQKRYGGTWAAAMAVCLKAAWQSAKLARNGIVH